MSEKPKLAYTVWVDDKPYGPDDDVPAKVAAKIGDHCWEGGKAPAAPKQPKQEPGDDIPPMGGAGSSEDAWRAYAEKLEVDVSAAKTRDEIVDALKAAGKPVERATN